MRDSISERIPEHSVLVSARVHLHLVCDTGLPVMSSMKFIDVMNMATKISVRFLAGPSLVAAEFNLKFIIIYMQCFTH